MQRYFRTWYLLLYLHKKTLAHFDLSPEIQGVKGVADGNFIYFGKHFVLRDIAKKQFFFFPRSIKSQRRRMATDDSILEVCINETPQKIQQRTAEEVGLWREEYADNMGEIRKNSPMIRITGHGDDFASPINFFFVHLPAKYKWLGIGFTTLCGFIWVYLIVPYLPLLCKSLDAIKLCIH